MGNGFQSSRQLSAPLHRVRRTANGTITADLLGWFIELAFQVTEQKLKPPGELGEDWYCYIFNGSQNISHTISAPFGSSLTGFFPNRAPYIVIAPGDFILLSSNGASFDVIYLQRRQQGFNRSALYTSADTFVVFRPSDYRITAGGAGGSGGIALSLNGSGVLVASGGAAGGVTSLIINLIQSYVLSIIPGSGGSGVTRATGGVTNGNPGGTTTVAGTLLALSATGGAGGTAGLSGTAAGAVGGVGSGGSSNYQGGGSGAAIAGAVASTQVTTGGGAPALYGPYSLAAPGPTSGTATCNTTARSASTGGAGVGGNSGNADGTAASAASGGGGSASGTGISFQGTSPDALGANSAGGQGNPLANHNINFSGAGTPGLATATVAAAAGAGSGGVAGTGLTSGAAGLMAGSGGISTTGISGTSGVPGIGAGSGGVAVSNAAATGATSAKGGDGWVLLEWWED